MVWVELVCDVCCSVYTDGCGPADLRRSAKAAGWKFAWWFKQERMCDFCPKCWPGVDAERRAEKVAEGRAAVAEPDFKPVATYPGDRCESCEKEVAQRYEVTAAGGGIYFYCGECVRLAF